MRNLTTIDVIMIAIALATTIFIVLAFHDNPI